MTSDHRAHIIATIAKHRLSAAAVQIRFGVSKSMAHKLVAEAR